MRISRRFFLKSSGACAGSLLLPSIPLIAKPSLPGMAFIVGSEDQGCEVVWANGPRQALDWWFGDCLDDCARFLGGDACDECAHLDVERSPRFDGFRATGVPLDAYWRAGWHMPCERCREAGVYVGGWSAADCCAEDWDPIPMPDGSFAAVCHECMTPREHLLAGGDPADWTYAPEHMDTPWAALPRDVLPLAEMAQL